jgi:hypothetical protein
VEQSEKRGRWGIMVELSLIFSDQRKSRPKVGQRGMVDGKRGMIRDRAQTDRFFPCDGWIMHSAAGITRSVLLSPL